MLSKRIFGYGADLVPRSPNHDRPKSFGSAQGHLPRTTSGEPRKPRMLMRLRHWPGRAARVNLNESALM
jgi:hypothetical protein